MGSGQPIRLHPIVNRPEHGYRLLGDLTRREFHTPQMKLGLFHYLSTAYDGKRQARLLTALDDYLGCPLTPAVDVEAVGLKALTVREFCETFYKETELWPLDLHPRILLEPIRPCPRRHRGQVRPVGCGRQEP